MHLRMPGRTERLHQLYSVALGTLGIRLYGTTSPLSVQQKQQKKTSSTLESHYQTCPSLQIAPLAERTRRNSGTHFRQHSLLFLWAQIRPARPCQAQFNVVELAAAKGVLSRTSSWTRSVLSRGKVARTTTALHSRIRWQIATRRPCNHCRPWRAFCECALVRELLDAQRIARAPVRDYVSASSDRIAASREREDSSPATRHQISIVAIRILLSLFRL